jgi:serine/threonine protein kinase
MNPNLERKEALFEAARQLASPAERAAYLDGACGNDPELRRQVEGMLADEAGAEEFFRAIDSLGDSVRELAVETPAESVRQIAEGPGTVIGRYTLIERLGEGGFGVVYLAEQKEPVARQVALKIIKPGLDTREVVTRFEAERQALALMDHPNIARILDGGATETGRPYFVMDLVRGLPITEFCDTHRLAPRPRLELFIKVCQAVQHAHQKGIIHRDLKPSNVLIAQSEPGQPGQPKVIDFGIAKALNQRLTARTLVTRQDQLMGTPDYMSPEQADGSGVDVDTRSDIYSLGALLYELLTGTPPFDRETLKRCSLEEIRRIIRETEPPKPSTRLTVLVAADVRRLTSNSEFGVRNSELDRASSRRFPQEKREFISALRGDLDWIVMKCLEKDRTRRYETANGLAMDIRRYLNDDPVLAAAPSARYRMLKFVRRHRAGLAVAAALFTVLVGGVIVSTWQMVRARQAEMLAEQRLKEVEMVRRHNEIGANSDYSVVGGGYDNHIANNSPYAVIPGGRENSAASYAFAAGRRAKANQTGAFVWADSQDADFFSATNNEFAVRASGGVRLETGGAGLKVGGRVGIGNAAPFWPLDIAGSRSVVRLVTSNSPSGSTLEFRNDTRSAEDMGSINFNDWTSTFPGQIAYKVDNSMTFQTARAERLRIDSQGRVGIGTTNPAYPLHLASGAHCTGGGAWVNGSDRHRKENFERVDGRAVLEQVARLPITRWNYKAEDKTVRHLGPTAQDFKAAFTVGESDTAIATVDADGVALAAIQGLNQKVESENRQLREALDAKAGELNAVKQRLAALEQLLSRLNLQRE